MIFVVATISMAIVRLIIEYLGSYQPDGTSLFEATLEMLVQENTMFVHQHTKYK